MFAYCGSNPVNCSDPCGKCIHRWYLLGLVDCDECKAKKERETSLTISYDVPLYKQGTLSLCWAFCEVMVASYKSGTTLRQSEAEEQAIKIAKEYYQSEDKSVWNDGGWPSDLGSEISTENIYRLYLALKNGPAYALYSNPETGESHLVVVTGVNPVRDIVYTNNPWGVSGKQTFAEFKMGVATRWFQSDRGMRLVAVYSVQ